MTLEEEVKAVLEGMGKFYVPVCEGGGPENIAASLAVSVAKIEMEVNRLKGVRNCYYDCVSKTEGDLLARRLELVSVALTRVLIADEVLIPNSCPDGPELILAAESYCQTKEHDARKSQEG